MVFGKAPSFQSFFPVKPAAELERKKYRVVVKNLVHYARYSVKIRLRHFFYKRKSVICFWVERNMIILSIQHRMWIFYIMFVFFLFFSTCFQWIETASRLHTSRFKLTMRKQMWRRSVPRQFSISLYRACSVIKLNKDTVSSANDDRYLCRYSHHDLVMRAFKSSFWFGLSDFGSVIFFEVWMWLPKCPGLIKEQG